jgi:transcriptional regulator with XRE-family HTH domain
MTASNELGAFLRARRARVQPTDVGLPTGTGLRRTPGLRREELAALAGISIEYCVRLEQGKETNPSGPVLDALARALRLGREERAHLYGLANQAANRAPGVGPVALTVRAGARQLLDTVRPCPAFVVNRVNDVLAANPEGLALLTGITDWPEPRRNTVRYTFLHAAARTLYPDWEKAAADSLAQLRTLQATDAQAPDLAALVAELNAESPEFAALWERYDVRRRRAEQKTFRHPQAGEFTLTAEVLHLGEEGQRITVYQADPDSRDQDALAVLSAATSFLPPTGRAD